MHFKTSGHFLAAAVPTLVKVLAGSSWRMKEQCACCLGNIAADGPTARMAVLHAGGLSVLLGLLSSSFPQHTVAMARSACWAISSLCLCLYEETAKGSAFASIGFPHFQHPSALLRVLIQSMLATADEEVLIHLLQSAEFIFASLTRVMDAQRNGGTSSSSRSFTISSSDNGESSNSGDDGDRVNSFGKIVRMHEVRSNLAVSMQQHHNCLQDVLDLAMVHSLTVSNPLLSRLKTM
jgi:hypothetical protein